MAHRHTVWQEKKKRKRRFPIAANAFLLTFAPVYEQKAFYAQ